MSHYTPNPGDSTCLQYSDVVKLDFGTEVNGRSVFLKLSVGYIIDSAFTVAFDPQFDELLRASQEATYAGIREAGVGARLGEIGGVIEEVIRSFEVTIHGRTYQSGSLYLSECSSTCRKRWRSFDVQGNDSCE